MDVLGDVIGRGRRSGDPALSAPATGRRYDYRRFCTSAWKTGNFLRHLGVRSGVEIAIADDPVPEAVLTLYGAALLGGVVTFDPPHEIGSETRALVVPAADVDAYRTGASTKRVVYGDPPDDPSISYFERDVWSENPTESPNHVAPDDPVLRVDGDDYSHADVLQSARTVIDRNGIEFESTVAVRGSFSELTVVVAGLVAPIVAGAQISIGPKSDGDHIVGGPESDIHDRIV